MIATIDTTSARRRRSAREQWSNPLGRARILAGQLLHHDRRWRRGLVEDHLGLLDVHARFFAARYPGLDREDARQAGFEGLARAAEKFDPEHPSGAAFSTFAFQEVRAAIQQARPHITGGPIRIPKRPSYARPAVSSIDDADHGGAPEPEDRAACDPFEVACAAEDRERVRAALGQLRPRDALVAELRFGINGAGRPHTLAEVAERLGVTGERVRQIEARALGALGPLLADRAL